MISDKRGCFWCINRKGLKCLRQNNDLGVQLWEMGWEVDEESLKKSLSGNWIGKSEEEHAVGTYTKDMCFGCQCSGFKRNDKRFVFR